MRINNENIKTIRFRNYKSFKSEYSSIDLKPITVLIGKNNCGKSSCIDIIEFLKNADKLKKQNCQIEIDLCCTESALKEIFKEYRFSDRIIRDHIDQVFALKLKVENRGYSDSRNIVQFELINKYNDNIDKTISDAMLNSINRSIIYLHFRRLDAERDIIPEPYSNNETLSVNGDGACNLINRVLNYSGYDERIIQKDLLNALNDIMYPDSKFDGITVQKIEETAPEKWEVYLYEGNERFPLSKTGTGLKTIILVLLNLLVLPKLENYSEDSLKIFAFEELENNLHPALQRRLFDYIDQYVSKNKATYVFLTTHSHIAINTFADNDNSQLLHITKEDGISSIHKIDDFVSKCEVLDDLDVRASDLFQSNGIIWVEGPSDRVYIKRWFELWGDKDLIEGRDYQFLYYGGRMLSHYTTINDEVKTASLISIITTNRNSAIVIDSDITNPNSKINGTKRRIKAEFKDKEMFCWITKGKEIENYVPFPAINQAYNSKLKTQCKRFELFPEYIKSTRKNFTSENVVFANKVCSYINIDNADVLDVKEKIEELCQTIRKWNYK